MTTIEKPTDQTSATMNNIDPALNQGDTIADQTEVDTFKIPVLGKIATREDYQQSQFEPTDQAVDPAQFDNVAEAAIQDAEDDEVQDELFAGFHINDATQPETTIDENHDELPDDLQDELGESDDGDEINDAA